jgi:predicted Zn-dependent protease
MKRGPILAVLVLAAGLSIYFSQRSKDPTAVSPDAVLDIAADMQRDVTRAPMGLTRISDEEEIRIGDALAKQYLPAASSLSGEEAALQQYEQRVGETLTPRAHRKLPYRFHLLPDRNMINAFALPGGHIVVGEGLLDLMTSEDEMANVLAHEVEHVDHYHCVERVQIEAQFRKLHLDVLGQLIQLPLSVWEAGYSKDQEMEADREGMRLATLSGYSPYGAVTMFQKFEKLHDEYVIHARSPEQELSQLAIESVEGYFRTHPPISERLDLAEAEIRQNRWQHLAVQKPFHLEYEVHRQ